MTRRQGIHWVYLDDYWGVSIRSKKEKQTGTLLAPVLASIGYT